MICCFAGLAEFAVPVMVGEQHVATLVGGQVFERKPTHTQFLQVARRLQAGGLYSESGQIEAAFYHTGVLPRKQIQASIQLLIIFTKLLANDVNRNLLTDHVQDQPCITSAKDFILTHASEPLYLRDVAEHVHVSRHYFCKFFKKATGMRFSEFLARTRVENAKNLLADPVLLITEAANQAGFGSLSQFNRIFHRYVGCSPTAYRASIRNGHSF
jgi:AraC-like DNA-binding protein